MNDESYVPLSQALQLDPTYEKAIYRQLQALHKLKKLKHAQIFCDQAMKMFPTSSSLKQLKETIESDLQLQARRYDELPASHKRRLDSIKTRAQQHPELIPSHAEQLMLVNDDSKLDEIDEEWLESQPIPTVSFDSLQQQQLQQQIYSFSFVEQQLSSLFARLVGHSNIQTDIKEVNFLWNNRNNNDSVVVVASDDGCLYCYETTTSRLLHVVELSEDVLNCCQVNPNNNSPVVACSGLLLFLLLFVVVSFHVCYCLLL